MVLLLGIVVDVVVCIKRKRVGLCEAFVKSSKEAAGIVRLDHAVVPFPFCAELELAVAIICSGRDIGDRVGDKDRTTGSIDTLVEAKDPAIEPRASQRRLLQVVTEACRVGVVSNRVGGLRRQFVADQDGLVIGNAAAEHTGYLDELREN